MARKKSFKYTHVIYTRVTEEQHEKVNAALPKGWSASDLVRALIDGQRIKTPVRLSKESEAALARDADRMADGG